VLQNLGADLNDVLLENINASIAMQFKDRAILRGNLPLPYLGLWLLLAENH
jgi:hypothetical protein